MCNLQFSGQLYEADMDATVAGKDTDRWSDSPTATHLVNGRSGCASCPSNFTSWALSLSGDDENVGNQVLMRCGANPRSLAIPKLSLLPGQEFTALQGPPPPFSGMVQRNNAVQFSTAGHTGRLHFPVSFAGRQGHVIKCWPMENCQK